MCDDPLSSLQAAARQAAQTYTGMPPTRIIIIGPDGKKLLDVNVPTLLPEALGQAAAGWRITDSSATYEGKPVAIGTSRLPLLRALVEAKKALTARELTTLVFDSETDEANTRYHIRELKAELKEAFPKEDEEVLIGGAEGYRLRLRR